MVRIRFHGRGGHGVKTASRIAGAAAFAAGRFVQDSPIYGAERRGAPVRAFTRVADEPILERGDIVKPDLIVLADPSLLHDPVAGVLGGQDTAAAVFVNVSPESANKLVEEFSIGPQLVALDLTTRTIEAFGRASALSSGLAAAAIRLAGVADREEMLGALRDELEHLHIGAEELEKNAKLAGDVFDLLEKVDLRIERPAAAGGERTPVPAMHRLESEGPLRSAPSVLLPGNAEARNTGAWRVETPEIDYERCIKCGLCFARCPDGAISVDEHGYPVIDYDHCKGCMICRNVCPIEQGIGTHKETEAW